MRTGHSSLAEGETSKSCHEKCGDTRYRLYHTRKGNYILYCCHNCGHSGRLPLKGYRPTKKIVTASHKVGMPRDVVYEIPMFPRVGQDWIYKSRITREEAEEYKICYSASLNRVILPVYDGDGLAFFTARSLSPNHKPKYLTYKRPTLDTRPIFLTHDKDREVVVVCEDILSAIRVSQLPDYIGVALCGTAIDHHGLVLLKYIQPSEVIVYLDNDNAQVKKAQRVLRNRLTLVLGCDTTVVRHDRDPKDLSREELATILSGEG